MVYRLILPDWAKAEHPDWPKVQEGEFTPERVLELNLDGYNAYSLPNAPSHYTPGVTVDGSHIDRFTQVFIDVDLKDGVYATKEDFLALLFEFPLDPSSVVDSGNGVHAYWRASDLDAMSFLRLQRRLIRHFKSDDAMAKIYQLMRVPGTVNNKSKDEPKLCEEIYTSGAKYTCDDLDRSLPPISAEDEAYCKTHHDKTYKISAPTQVDDKLPLKFGQLLRANAEAKELFAGNTDDRSKADYRLGHLMFANGFTKAEAMSVLVNTAKALARAPAHRVTYAENIVEKIWTYETIDDKAAMGLSSTVREILDRSGNALKGTRFPCWRYLDATHHGFRLGQVIGLVAGSGVGKTAMALNMFMGYVTSNPDYDHFFIPLEQPANEIADRWRTMCGDKTHLYDKVHVISNYAEDGSFRHLSFDDIKDYLLKFQEVTKRKVGCVVIDHIGALKKKGRDGENQDLMDICHQMKAFAVHTNTLLIMQSQAPREKAGIGDLELNKDAAYGTVYFESYCDYLISIWQPLKRCYGDPQCPTVTAFKFCKIRHKKKHIDSIQEDVRYLLRFDPETEHMRELTQEEEASVKFWNSQATNDRKKDRKTDIVEYASIAWTKEDNGTPNSHQDAS